MWLEDLTWLMVLDETSVNMNVWTRFYGNPFNSFNRYFNKKHEKDVSLIVALQEISGDYQTH